ncbi:MAG: hypothetical protein ACLGSD_03040 [Acidobacteriota bacterium]
MSRFAGWRLVLLFAAMLFAASFAVAQRAVTLAQLTGNNTSASSSFGAVPDGDAAPGNVSKVSLKKLLPPGFSGKVLAHWMPWWKCSETPCEGSHDKRDPLRVHYSTEDAAQIDRTIDDMISRGYDGVMVAEANTAGADAAGALAMAGEMPKFPGFLFAVSENHLNKIHSPGEQLEKLMGDIAFDQSHFFRLANYLRIGGRPVVYVFDNGAIDWARAEEHAPGNPIFILNGPDHASGSMGGFFWFGGLPRNAEVSSNEELGKLDAFYAQVASNPGRIYSGAFFKGFDDRFAAWGEGRRVDQACGLTFVRSLAAVAKYLSRAPANLPLLQVATWNDYEEGTEVETGIDNCGSVSARVSGTMVKPAPRFTGEGSEETVDHYEIYISVDGEHLMDAGAVGVGGASLDVATLGLAPGAYKVLVQMVGKSHILNRVSAPVQVAVGGVTTPGRLPAGLAAAPASELSPAPMAETVDANSVAPAGGGAAAAGAGARISVTSPVEGSQVSNPVTLNITTHEPFTVARIQVWDHGVKIVDQRNSPMVNGMRMPMSRGAHRLTINVKDESMTTRDSATVDFEVR